jgi:Rad3-related DNA helicase
MQEGWQFELQGRIDQIRPGPGTALIREIKTVSAELPAEEDFLRETWPQHFHQAMLYAFLFGRESGFPETELVFLDIQSAVTQTVRLGDEDFQSLHSHLRAVAEILEERRGHFVRLRSLSVPQPFPEWRDGQPEARGRLASALNQDKPILFEAPTGFGKTGLVLEQALLKLASGEAERIILLTGKNTGHSPLLNQLLAFKEEMPDLTIHALRSRKDHQVDADIEESFTRAEILERWAASGLSAPRLLADGVLDLEDVKLLGQRHGIPPWAISRFLLPFADVWIADFNYLFDPGVAQVLEGIPTFNPERTLLIVDEAHNLPDRAAGSRSHQLDARTVQFVHTEAQFARFPGKLPKLLDLLQSLLKKQAPSDSLDPPFEADLIGLLRDAASALKDSHFADDELSSESRDWLWNLPQLLDDWDQPDLPYHTYSPKKGCVHLACLDASRPIRQALGRFSRSILMSATLRPWDSFGTAIGYEKESDAVRILGVSPWLEGCFEILVDARVDTRFRQRQFHLETTARTIGESALAAKGCTVAFFPSYQYAGQVLERMPYLFPALRCELQPRDLNLEQQTDFLESALLFDDVLFLVLGSRFSEGIDALGGRVGQAIVVGPALPEVNGLQKAREALTPGNASVRFHAVYLIPGLRKISQALGRLVRSPDQRARVLLHGKRFMEPDHQDLLPEYLRPCDTIITDEELEQKWLRGG